MASIYCDLELTVFELTMHFNPEKIGKWQKFSKKFELSVTMFKLSMPDLYLNLQPLEKCMKS